MLDELSIKKDDAKFYIELKEERHKASYATEHGFSQDKILFYKQKIINFLHRTEKIIFN